MKVRKHIRRNSLILERHIDNDVELSFDSFDKFRKQLISHDNYEDHTLLIVGVENEFLEEPNGSYRKSYKCQTNIMEVHPDKESYTNVNMMNKRLRFQGADCFLAYVWVSNDSKDYFVDMIRKDDKPTLELFVNTYLKNKKGR